MCLLLRNKVSSIWYCIVTPLIINRVIDFFVYSICVSQCMYSSMTYFMDYFALYICVI
jgi:hypothetical protein